jgi:wyosine [tRNA(Phe)-imidazoG37] synthetase (radical SAM superfamily)
LSHRELPVSSIVYGPVPSWRLGRSLGIDLLSTECKTCSFDCIYCQLGPTVHPLTERREFVTLSQVASELEAVQGVEADYATFSGVGEPTLAANLGAAISLSKSLLDMPVAVLTNSWLMPREDVRRDLAAADVVVAKVDAADEETFHRVNRPVPGYCLDEVLRGIELFRRSYQGRLALQMMFVEANKHAAAALAQIARRLSPDEVQLNTPLRPCGTRPLSPQEMAAIKREFAGLKVVEVYQAAAVEVRAFDAVQTLRRRPQG